MIGNHQEFPALGPLGRFQSEAGKEFLARNSIIFPVAYSYEREFMLERVKHIITM